MTLTPEEVRGLLEEVGALLHGHFILSSGLHSPEYWQCARLIERPEVCERVSRALAERASDLGAEVVLAPALGAVVFGYEVAKFLGARYIFAERGEGGRMTLRRGFFVNPGERALIVEDVVTTGGTTKELLGLVREAEGEPCGVVAIVDRSGGRVSFEVPFRALLTVEAVAYKPEECPLCKRGVPAEKPGSRKG